LTDLRPVLVIDFGAQYSQLIARRIREAGFYSEIIPFTASAKSILAKNPSAIFLSGGPSSVYQDGAPRPDPQIFKSSIPLFGICYGAQLIAQELGGNVEKTGFGEYGDTNIKIDNNSSLFSNLDSELSVWMSHKDSIVELPDGYVVTGMSTKGPVAAFENLKHKIFGLQFHPEVAHSSCGPAIFKNFLCNILKLEPNWRSDFIIESSIKRIVDEVKGGRAICALSGGLDSTVAAVLVNKAIGDRLTCVFVDTGLLRKNEAKEVEASFKNLLNCHLEIAEESHRFFENLSGVSDPEEKRIIIGNTFISVFESYAQMLGNFDYLVQGTLYPDVIESGSNSASIIKSHHNVGGLPEEMNFKLIEPLRELFKDEVRMIGAELGLPADILYRQPFPGPGLAVRIVGPVDKEKVRIVQEADYIVTDEIKSAGLVDKLWQYFAVLLPVKAVGVMGDARTYDYPVVIRAVNSQDAMTADWARLEYELLARISSRIVSEVPGVNRVLYDITSKPPGTIEWE
jgi:GMP synthase (glutamine-hydrolysing)